jgi:hypothetical protein
MLFSFVSEKSVTACPENRLARRLLGVLNNEMAI